MLEQFPAELRQSPASLLVEGVKVAVKTIYKAIISLLVTAFVPVIEGGLLFVLFLALVSLSPTTVPGLDLAYLGALAGLIMAASVMLLLGYLIALMYTFLLGLPALLIGWYFRAIRWWTTMIMAFLIGAIPATLSVLASPIGQPAGTPIWQSTSPADLIWAGSSGLMFGFMGLTSGLVFWLLWRYWVQPHFPAGRPRPVKMEPSALQQ
ncbi:MAG: hypothetical protein QM730_24690 [Anaerolineales bacterium]